MNYVPNPRHKEPWQPGRKGTLCREGLDDGAYARLEQRTGTLLEEAILDGNARFQTFEGRAYKAVEDPSTHAWHGYPVGWVEVPESIWRKWVQDEKVKRSDVNRHWTLGAGR